MGGWDYLMTNRPNGTLNVGVTADFSRRASEHREGVADGFTRRYGLKRLVFAERHDDILAAKERESAWKVQPIRPDNPFREDLYDKLL